MTSLENKEEINRIIDDLLSDVGKPLKDDLSDEKARKLLEDIARAVPEDQGLADTDAVIGGTFINVKGITWAMVKAIVALGLAIAPDPTGLTKVGAAGIVWAVIKDSNGHLRKLNSAEQIVVTAIASKGGEHWRADGHEYGVNLVSIGSYFEENEQIVPPGLDDILTALETKGVITVVPTVADGKTYRIAF